MSDFKLEAGKCYIDRKGRVFGPMVCTNGLFGEVEGEHGWYYSGRRSLDTLTPLDLITEYHSLPDPVSDQKPPVDPGEGYRLLEPGELVIEGDEFILSDGRWEECGNWGQEYGGRQGRDLVYRRTVSPKTRKVLLKEYVCWDTEYPDVLIVRWASVSPMLDAGNLMAFDRAYPTGAEKEVETATLRA